MIGPRILRLEAGGHPGAVRFLTGLQVSLAEGRRTSTVTLTRTGTFHDHRYGEFEISREMLLGMVRNFEAGTYGQDIFVDVSHRPQHGAAGKLLSVSVEGNRLRGEVEWTDFGRRAIRERGFQYLSAEYHEDWKDNETGRKHGPVLLGAALTVRPVIKRLEPIQLAEDDGGHPRLLHPELQRRLTEEIAIMKDKFLKLLAEALKKFEGLKMPIVKQLSEAFAEALDGVTEEAKAKLLLEAFTETGRELAEELGQGGGDGERTIRLDFSGLQAALQGGGGLSAEDVRKLLAEETQKQAEQTKKLAEDRQARVDQFNGLLDAAEGLKSLSEDQQKALRQAAELITADMSEDQVKRLAEHQIQLGGQVAAAARLAGMGWPGPQGSVRITTEEGNKVKELQETVDRRLGLLDMADSRRYAATGGQLQEVNKRFAEKVLAEFDAQNARQLHAEHKMLAAGDGLVSDVNVPVSWERTVIREALYRLIGLQFVDVGTETFATSYMIPYSYRDSTAAGRTSARKYEGQAIARAGVIQTAETAYNTPQKLAFEVSDELRYLTAARHLNWDAVAENQRNASRIVGEDTEHLIFNETLNASDQYAVTAVSNENLELQADDVKNIFVLAQWPVVRPKLVYDLQGNQVGSTLYPITVTYDGVARAEWDGTGTQPVGIYWVMDYNLGEIYLCDKDGAIQVPANATAYTISYTYTTNVYKFDTDLGGATARDHWDTFLYRFGLRKSVIEDDRYYMANFGLMSGTVANQVEQAAQFAANFRRPGTELSADGNIGRIKDVPQFKSSAPGLYMGDQRVLVGERGVTRFRMAKPWMLGELENQKDSNGRYTGKKEAYGDQFVVIHTPTQLKAALTSIVLYSATGRVARAA